jgi:hypothetical protein
MTSAPAPDRPPAGLSVSDAKLYEHLVGHIESESGLITEYERLIASPSAYVSFLAALIAEDERRHHGLYEDWIESLKAIAELQFAGLPPVITDDDAADLVSTTERLLEFERNDAAELKQLERQIKDLKDTTLWGLVVEIMRMDTEKHIRILDFIRTHAQRKVEGRH